MCFLRPLFPRPGRVLPLSLSALALALTLAATGPAAAADPPRYTAVQIEGLPVGSGGSVGINNRGDLVIPLSPANGPSHALLVSGGVVTDLGVRDGAFGQPTSLNSFGAVVGSSPPVTGVGGPLNGQRATLWSPSGGAVDLGNLGGRPTDPSLGGVALAINDSGLIVGISGERAAGEAGVILRAVSWKDGLITALAMPEGAESSQARDVNSSGLIAGNAISPSGVNSRAVVWRNGVPEDLGTLGGSFGWASAINDAGWVVGYSTTDPSGRYNRGTLWKDGAVIDLGFFTPSDINSAGDVIGSSYMQEFPFRQFVSLYTDGVMYEVETLLTPESPGRDILGYTMSGINDAGQFTAFSLVDGEYRLFLYSRVPEPSAAGLAVSALTGALPRRRRGR